MKRLYKKFYAPVLKPSCAALGILCLVFFLSPKAFAQCELEMEVDMAQTAMESAEEAAVAAMVAAVKVAWNADLTTAQAVASSAISDMREDVLAKLDWLWEQWLPAMKDMAQQVAAGSVDQSRQMASIEDASDLTNLARESQIMEAEAKKRYQPTSQGCQFDTIAGSLGRSEEVSKGVAKGYALDFNKVGVNDKDTPAGSGMAALQQSRWQIYQSKFCDSTANNGKSGCTTAPTALTNLHTLPSRTIFAKETIDFSNADIREAINQLLFNITGYEAPDPVLLGSLSSATGLQQFQTNREYTAQMDAVGALAYSVVADRAPGKAAPGIQAMRRKMGIADASDKPSKREIRQAVVEQLWDPNYYKELYDNPATITQKELYLKAYSLVMLYDMIEKQEKISNVYAIETANMLEQSDVSRHAVTSSAPLK